MSVIDGGVACNSDNYRVTKGRECTVRPIRCVHTVDGIRPHMIEGIGQKTCDTAVEAARAIAIWSGTTTVVHRGICGRTPTYTTSRHIRTAIECHTAAAGGRGGGNACNIVRYNHRHKGIHRHCGRFRGGTPVAVGTRHGVGGGGCRTYRDTRRGVIRIPVVIVCPCCSKDGALAAVYRSVTCYFEIHLIAKCGKHFVCPIGDTDAVHGKSPYMVGGVGD